MGANSLFFKSTHSTHAKYAPALAYYIIDGEDFVNFCGLLRKHELYLKSGHEIVLFVLQGKDLFHFDLTCISPTLSCICRLKG